jgi:hypothetical protein
MTASYPKTNDNDGDDDGTRLRLSPGAKRIQTDDLRFNGGIADINKAPTSRVYTRDYTKVGRDKEDTDLVTAALGPFGRI